MIAAVMLIGLVGAGLGLLLMVSPLLRRAVKAHRWAVLGYGLAFLFFVGALAGMAEHRRAPTHAKSWRYATVLLAFAMWATTCATVIGQGIRKRRERDKGMPRDRIEDIFTSTHDDN